MITIDLLCIDGIHLATKVYYAHRANDTLLATQP